ncbi:MAG: MFS transporter, partial [Gammaproteobacteria bacterium]|nr:MFS transporter [Gammaproteobacteria bacterium]
SLPGGGPVPPLLNTRLDRRYVIVASAFVIQGVTIGCLFAYGVFFTVLQSELGWSRALLSGCSSMALLTMGIVAMFGGRLADLFGPRGVLTVAGICTGLGYAFMYYMTAEWQLFVLFGLLVGIGLSAHDVVTLSTIARWFKRRRGMMTGIVKVGTACGQVAMPLLATVLIAQFGWRTACAALGCSAGVILLIAASGMRRPESADGLPPGDHTHEAGLSLTAAVGTPVLWKLCAIQFAFLTSLTTIPLHIVAHGMDLGMAQVNAAAVLSAIGGVSIVGRLVIGSVVDRIGGRRALLFSLVPLLLSLIWVRFIDEPWLLFMFAALYGFAHGGLFTVVSPIVAEFFGMSSHGAIFGVILFFGTLGGALGPLLAGWTFDAMGSYDMAFVGLAALVVCGFLLSLSLRPMARA